MTNQEILEKLNFHLLQLNEMLALGDLGLLKSEELHNTKHEIEDELKTFIPFFEKVEALKIEKTIPKWRNVPKTGMFLDAHQVNPVLKDLHVLVQELINVKGGSEQIAPVAIPEIKITGKTINQAISDAKTLLSTEGAPSALDRIHTVLHGYLKQECEENNIQFPVDANINQLVKALKGNHPALLAGDENVNQILQSMANVLDKLNPIRNNSSLAHPNENILNPEEALFVVNTVNTLLGYFHSKFSKTR